METIASLHPMFHIGALVSVVALALRSQLQLRLVLLLSLLLYIGDNYFGSDRPDWPTMTWNVLFFSINLFVVIEIILDRTTLGMSAEEKAVFGGFLSLSPGEFRRLVRIGRWQVAEDSRTITTEGVVPMALYYIYLGGIEISKGGRSIRIEPPTFIGEIAFLRGSAASASASITPGSHYIEWSAAQLHRYLERHSHMRVAFNRALSDDLALKVARS